MAPPDPLAEWQFLLYGYLVTVFIEGLVLLPGLSARHPLIRRLFACVWLNACSYPVVVLVLPHLLNADDHYAAYLWVAEIFAPVAECVLFWAAFGVREDEDQTKSTVGLKLHEAFLKEVVEVLQGIRA